ncbi:MAG: hypothetical protein HN872_08195 [Gammaproteobacteria bacterium]|nr:hypothetical protein [Gammaproteobacteria bacterium]
MNSQSLEGTHVNEEERRAAGRRREDCRAQSQAENWSGEERRQSDRRQGERRSEASTK